jgi:hypothetical protein
MNVVVAAQITLWDKAYFHLWRKYLQSYHPGIHLGPVGSIKPHD